MSISKAWVLSIALLSMSAARAEPPKGEQFPEHLVKFNLPVNSHSTYWNQYCEDDKYAAAANAKANIGLRDTVIRQGDLPALAHAGAYCGGWEVLRNFRGLVLENKVPAAKEKARAQEVCLVHQNSFNHLRTFNRGKAALYASWGNSKEAAEEKKHRDELQKAFDDLGKSCEDSARSWKAIEPKAKLVNQKIHELLGWSEPAWYTAWGVASEESQARVTDSKPQRKLGHTPVAAQPARAPAVDKDRAIRAREAVDREEAP